MAILVGNTLDLEDGRDDLLPMWRQACTLFKTGDLSAAHQLFSSILDRWPDDASSLYKIGAIYMIWGEYDRALEPLYKAVQLRPKDQEISQLYFFTLCNLQRIDHALQEAERYIKLCGYTQKYRKILKNMRCELESAVEDTQKS